MLFCTKVSESKDRKKVSGRADISRGTTAMPKSGRQRPMDRRDGVAMPAGTVYTADAGRFDECPMGSCSVDENQ